LSPFVPQGLISAIAFAAVSYFSQLILGKVVYHLILTPSLCSPSLIASGLVSEHFALKVDYTKHFATIKIDKRGQKMILTSTPF